MAKVCRILAIICFIAAVILLITEKYISALIEISSIFIFLVIAEHLDNQKKLIEATNAVACPQLFYITTFAPKLVSYFLSINATDYHEDSIKFQPPVFTADGSYIIKGHTIVKMIPKYFEMAFITGEHFHRINDWQLANFKWF